MQSWIEGFNGISQSGYGVEICGGKHLSTPQGEFVEMKHGGEYAVKVINYNSHRCLFNLKIDGLDQGSWQFGEQVESKLERPAEVAKKFTFYRVKHAPKSSGIEKGKAENGLVSCTFTPERNARMVHFHLSELGKNAYGVTFEILGKNSTLDLANKLNEVMKNKFYIDNSSDYEVVRWPRDSPKSYLHSYVSLTGDRDTFLCHAGFKEGTSYEISAVKRITTAKVTYTKDSFEYNLISGSGFPELQKAIKERWGLDEFYLITDKGRVIAHYIWAVGLDLINILQRHEIETGVKDGCFNFTVAEELPSDSQEFEVGIKTLTGETIIILINPETSVNEMKLKVQHQQGIPRDQQRLLAGGKQLEESSIAADSPVLMTEKILLLVLRLRGGGRAPEMEIKASEAASESAEGASGGKKLNAPDSDWRSGATTLGNKSEQTFRSVAAISVDHSKAVTLSVRLVAIGDELTEEEYRKVEHMKCTPLATAVPPSMPE